ncbi:MAG: hypothetical protein HOV73_27975 [Streptomyces sp.]|uniref:hypothetical protein n=1 Tax=Streptomyces sp. NPDC051913 TaxID=3365676 RepID=UPI0017BA77B2|nr:hypothetical protein [Streptomyces sp.]NUR43924.1 hypothetical protein [Streptomyces sp.]NUR66821.1 hypothetical protein [Streptomyces sp.]NUS24696.1 hypothetical protein [Streptomyces sp.]NUS79698.1 hypothetical protein [Streptomyces sp.]
MSDARTIQPPHTDSQGASGHGRHRGQVSAQDGDSAPRGRHRKPADEKTESAA